MRGPGGRAARRQVQEAGRWPCRTAETGRSLCERRDTPLLRGARRGSASSAGRQRLTDGTLERDRRTRNEGGRGDGPISTKETTRRDETVANPWERVRTAARARRSRARRRLPGARRPASASAEKNPVNKLNKDDFAKFSNCPIKSRKPACTAKRWKANSSSAARPRRSSTRSILQGGLAYLGTDNAAADPAALRRRRDLENARSRCPGGLTGLTESSAARSTRRPNWPGIVGDHRHVPRLRPRHRRRTADQDPPRKRTARARTATSAPTPNRSC